MNHLIEGVKEIAIEAGKAIMTIYADESQFDVQSKTDESPLTKADLLANDIIVKGLKNLETIYPIISEENKQIPYEDRKDYEHFWLVDPLDGTKEFIKRNGEFTVNIALVHRGRSVMGVVYVPAREELYWAVKGEGAFGEVAGEKMILIAPIFHMTDKGLRIVCSRSHVNEETQAYIDQLVEPESVSCGSSLKFITIAKGDAEIYPRLGPTMEWDTGAAQIILEEAGGSVVKHEGGDPLDYNKESLLNPYFIALGRERK